MEDFGPSVKLVDNGADRTLIWFGGLFEPFLNMSFLPPGWNGLILLDAKQDWFTTGVEGFASSFEDTVARISTIVTGHTRVCAGQSSGGYGALRFAHALSADLCVAFSPQTHNVLTSKGWMRPWVEIPSVADVYRASPPTFPVVVHLSRSEKESEHLDFWDDWAHVAPLQDLDNVTIVRHPFDVHAVTLKLSSQGRFYKAVVASIESYF